MQKFHSSLVEKHQKLYINWRAKMTTSELRKYRFVILVITAAFLLASCDTIFKKSAMEATGGVGAGLSEYQNTPIP
jgi:hypothetical protein